MKKTNSKQYPTIQYLQGVIIVPANIEQITDDEGNVSYNWIRVDLEDNQINRAKSDETLMVEVAESLLNQEKKERLDAGFMVNGVLFDSDSNARLAYAELAMKFRADPSYTIRWKASSGVWVDMDYELFQAVYAAGEVHISSVFEWLEIEQAKLQS